MSSVVEESVVVRDARIVDLEKRLEVISKHITTFITLIEKEEFVERQKLFDAAVDTIRTQLIQPLIKAKEGMLQQFNTIVITIRNLQTLGQNALAEQLMKEYRIDAGVLETLAAHHTTKKTTQNTINSDSNNGSNGRAYKISCPETNKTLTAAINHTEIIRVLGVEGLYGGKDREKLPEWEQLKELMKNMQKGETIERFLTSINKHLRIEKVA